MAYSTHGFTQGQKLTETLLKEMDNQIAAQDTALALMDGQIADAQKAIVESMYGLSLSSDGANVYLTYGEDLISETAITFETSSVVPCTALSLSSAELQIPMGQTYTLAPVRQPANCNQSLRYYSDDPTNIPVSASGVITANGAARAKIHVLCGLCETTVEVIVTKGVSTNSMYISGNMYPRTTYTQVTDPDQAGRNNYITVGFQATDGENNSIVVTLDSFIEVPPGYIAQVTLADTDDTYCLRINSLALLYPVNPSNYSGDARLTDKFGFRFAHWTTGQPMRAVQDARAIATSKSCGETAVGANGGTWPGYNSNESDSIVNTDAVPGYLMLSLMTCRKAGNAQVSATSEIMQKVLASGCLTIQILPKEEYVPVRIESFSVSPIEALIGDTVSEITLNYEANKIPAAANIVSYSSVAGAENASDIGSVAALKSASLNLTENVINGTRIFRLYLSDAGGAVDNATALLEFKNYAYYGISLEPDVETGYTSDFVTALDSHDLCGNPSGKYVVQFQNWSEGYAFIAFPVRLIGDRTLGFKLPDATQLTFTLEETLDVTNSSGFTEQYALYKQDSEASGTLELIVV